MTIKQIELHELEARVVRRERRVFRLTLVFSFLPVVAAAALLWMTIEGISSARRELGVVRTDLIDTTAARDRARTDLAGLKDTITGLEMQAANAKEEVGRLQSQYQQSQARVRRWEERLAVVQENLRRTSQFTQHVYQFNWAEAKALASQIPRGGELLMRIDEYRRQGIGWGWENTRDKGFVSPGFAGFILQEMQVVPGELSPIDALFTLPLTNQQPRPGDVVVYDAGFAMFYFQDRDGKEFVIGMTLIGILALSYDFGVPRVGVRRTGLSP